MDTVAIDFGTFQPFDRLPDVARQSLWSNRSQHINRTLSAAMEIKHDQQSGMRELGKSAAAVSSFH